MDPAVEVVDGDKVIAEDVLKEFFTDPAAACSYCSRPLAEPVWLPCKHVFCELCSGRLNVAGGTSAKCLKCPRVFALENLTKDESLLATYTEILDKSSRLGKNPDLRKRSNSAVMESNTESHSKVLRADSTEPVAKRGRGRSKKQYASTMSSAAGLAESVLPPPKVEGVTFFPQLPPQSAYSKVGAWLDKSLEIEESPPPFRQLRKGKNAKPPKPQSAAEGSGFKDHIERQVVPLADSGIQSVGVPGVSALAVKGAKPQAKAGPSGVQNISVASGDQSPGWSRVRRASREIRRNEQTMKSLDISGGELSRSTVTTRNTKKIGDQKPKGVADSSKTAPGIATAEGELTENEQTSEALIVSSMELCKSVGLAKKIKKIESKNLKSAAQVECRVDSGKPAQETATTAHVKSINNATNLTLTRSLRARKGQSRLDKPLPESEDLTTSRNEVNYQNANTTAPIMVQSGQNSKQKETVAFVKNLIANTNSKNSVEIVKRTLRSYDFFSDSDSLEDDGLKSDLLLAMEHQTSKNANANFTVDPISEGDQEFPGFPSFDQNEIRSETPDQTSLKIFPIDDASSTNSSKGALVQENDQEASQDITKSVAQNKIVNRSNVSAVNKLTNSTKRKTFSLDADTQDLASIRVNEDSFDRRIHEIANANKRIKMPTEAISNVLMNVTNSPNKPTSKIVQSRDKMDISPAPKLARDSTHNPLDDDLIEQFRFFLGNKSTPNENPMNFSQTELRDVRPFFVACKGPFVSLTGEPIPGKRVLMELDPCCVTTQLRILQNFGPAAGEKLLLDEKSLSVGTKEISEISDNSEHENLQLMVVDPFDRHMKKVAGLVNGTPLDIAEKEVDKSLVADKKTSKEKVALEVSDHDSFPDTIPDTIPNQAFCGKGTLRTVPPTTNIPPQVSWPTKPPARVISNSNVKVKKPLPKSSDKPYPLRRKQKHNQSKAGAPKLTDPQVSDTQHDMHIDDKSETGSKKRFRRIKAPANSSESEDAIPDTDIFNDCDLPNRMSDEEPDSLEYLLDAHCRNIPSPESGTIDIVPMVSAESPGLTIKVATLQARAVKSPKTPESFLKVQRMIASSDKAAAGNAIRIEDSNGTLIDNDITHLEESPEKHQQVESLEDDGDDSEDICKATPEATTRPKFVRRLSIQKPRLPLMDAKENLSAIPEIAHIISTNLSLEDTKLLIQMVKMVGAKKDATFSEETTHLVAATSEEGCAQRTVKFIMALASGVWVVSPSWVHKCIETGSLVPETNYEAQDVVFGDSPRRSRLGGGRVFRDFAFYLMTPYAGQIEESEFKVILQLSGAAVVESPSDKGNKKYLVTLTNQEDSPKQTMINERFMAKYNSLVVAYSWVHTCICAHLLRSVWTHLPGDADVSERIRSGYPQQIFAPPTDSDDESDA